eukprot:CAMPEP_0185729688 /NCGR_PEP_ID=MMETSP1171-20130828/6980_1 /TAXON_ID=374046 /ORGANISM="Helicotheca tamensis, Strain CCMP826" /LENGTH=294 /DNA_ID=CAMNT_0028398585 /DNA_START=303 /DNA_END=1187 /DNA_ORIENTATION=-
MNPLSVFGFTGIGIDSRQISTRKCTNENRRIINNSPASTISSTSAFTAPWTSAKSLTTTTTTSRHMSSIGQDETDSKNKKAKKKKFNIWNYLPSPPEDMLTLGGDVAALFVYAYLDHTLNDFYGSVVRNGGDGGAAAAIDPILASEVEASQHLPVWYDAVATGIKSIPPPTEFAHYAPAINTAGTSAIVLTFIWLFSGYVTGAFLFRNTLECHSSRAILITGKTWLLSTVITVAVALASDAIGGHYDIVHYPSIGGLTKADADFIFGDLSVLTMWRFMISFILGSGEDDNDSAN